MKIISFANQKGGIGKTTLSINIAAILAEEGYKVLLIDNDPQSNSTFALTGAKYAVSLHNVLVDKLDIQDIIHKTNIENLDIAVNNTDSFDNNIELATAISREFKLKKAIEKANLNYDYILIDCNPNLDLNSINALVISDNIVIPLDESLHSFIGLSNLTNYLNMLSEDFPNTLNFNFVLNNIDRRTNLYKEFAEMVEKSYPNKLAKTQIGMSSIYNKLCYQKQTIIDYKSTKAYKELKELVKELKELWQ